MNFDIEPRFFSRSTGLRLPFNPDLALSVDWEHVQSGGTGQVVVKLALPFEVCPVSGGDIVEVWALGTGETVPRCRATVSIPDPTLDLKETQAITAYGLMEDMNHVVIDRVDCFPGGTDLSWFAAHIADDYQARRPEFVFVRELLPTGVNLETLTSNNVTARAAMNQLQSQAGINIVWGWDIDPTTGLDRLYMRPNVAAVGNQFFVGSNIKLISGANDLTQLANGMVLLGASPAQYPQLMTNPSYEVPQIPNASSGDLLLNGGFELGAGDAPIGGTGIVSDWDLLNGATRNAHDPASNHNTSAHSGKWYLLLDSIIDGMAEEAWQEVAVSLNVPYTWSLYCCRESGAEASQGQLILEGRTSAGDVVSGQTFTLALNPPSTAWTGGQGSTTLSEDSLSITEMFTDESVVKVRVRIVATANVLATKGLCIDDVVMSIPGEVGQLAWDEHLYDPSSDENKFVSINWANRGSAWDGVYGVQANVVANETYIPVICPTPGDDPTQSGYHFKPSPQQTLIVGFRVRTPSGVAGTVRVTYREWQSNGSQNQSVYGAWTTVPSDGAWVFVHETVTTYGNVDASTVQIEFGASGVYDVDGFTARDQQAGEGSDTSGGLDPILSGYMRGEQFSRYVRAEDVCTEGTPAYNSFSIFGRKEIVVTNKDITNWDADGIAWAAAYFNRYAVPINRNRLELLHETAQIPSPGNGTQIQVSGLNQADISEWCSRAAYTWQKLCLGITLELSNERPTLAKLLNQLSDATSGGGTSTSIPASGAGNISTSSPVPAATTAAEGIVQLAGDIAGTATNVLVVGIRGNPVSSTAPTVGQALIWNGTDWAPAASSGGGGGTGYTLLCNGDTPGVTLIGDPSGQPILIPI